MTTNTDILKSSEQHRNYVADLDRQSNSVLVLTVQVSEHPLIDNTFISLGVPNDDTVTVSNNDGFGSTMAATRRAETAFANCLDCSKSELLDILEEWIDMRRRGTVAEILVDVETDKFCFKRR